MEEKRRGQEKSGVRFLLRGSDGWTVKKNEEAASRENCATSRRGFSREKDEWEMALFRDGSGCDLLRNIRDIVVYDGEASVCRFRWDGTSCRTLTDHSSSVGGGGVRILHS